MKRQRIFLNATPYIATYNSSKKLQGWFIISKSLNRSNMFLASSIPVHHINHQAILGCFKLSYWRKVRIVS